jgi:hypothetical protein
MPVAFARGRTVAVALIATLAVYKVCGEVVPPQP